MIITAIQKNKINTYLPKSQNNNSSNAIPATKQIESGDKFVSNPTFKAARIDIDQLERRMHFAFNSYLNNTDPSQAALLKRLHEKHTEAYHAALAKLEAKAAKARAKAGETSSNYEEEELIDGETPEQRRFNTMLFDRDL